MNIEKLKNIVQQTVYNTGTSHQSVYDMFFFERLLYRLSLSEYQNNFVIKGGFLLETIFGIKQRTTLDIDLKAIKINLTNDKIVFVFTNICKIKCDDGIEYKIISVDDIKVDSKYEGKSIKIQAKLQNLKRIFSIDIAFGDIVTPYPINLTYKSIIDGKTFSILSYPVESIIAEKFETIISKGSNNSRAKDLFDIWLLMKETIDYEKLNASLINTFVARSTPFEKNIIHESLEQLYSSKYRINLFNQYVITHSFTNKISFEEVKNALSKIEKNIHWNYVELPKCNIELTLIRHGEDDKNKVGGWSTNKLTKKGIMQITNLSHMLDNNYDIIVASDLQRTKETAEIINKKLNCPLIYDSNFREIDNGIYKNMTVEEFMKNSKSIKFCDMKYEEKYPKGESAEIFYKRVTFAFINLLKQYEGKKVMLITHGGVITIIKCLIYNWKYSNMLQIDPPYASVTKLNL